jgi:short subunit dehydrogenase-like uncharacterized protein
MERLDMIVFGATGFTGKLIIDYLATNEEAKSVKWGVSGRDVNKIRGVLSKHQLQDKIPIIKASIDNQKSLNELCAQTRVLVNVVGPFAKYGEPVVKACLESRCHYMDITGEPGYIRKMTEKYHEEAKQKGVKIIHSIALDSVPADLGVQYTLEQFPTDQTLYEDTDSWVTVEGFMKLVTPDHFSFGTFSTMVASVNSISVFGSKKQKQEKPKKKEKKKGGNLKRNLRYENLTKSYVLPLSSSDPTIVNRTAELDNYFQNGKASFSYGNYLQVEKWYSILLMMLFGLFVFILTRFSFGEKLLLWLWLKIKGDGPRPGIRDSGYFSFIFLGYARFKNGIQKVICEVSAKGDPGYVETSKWATQAAFTLLDILNGKKKEIREGGGVLTPASCLGVHLRERLEKVGMKFATKHSSYAADKDDEKTILMNEAKKYVYMPN